MKKPYEVICDRSNNTEADLKAGRVNITVRVPLKWIMLALKNDPKKTGER